MRRDAARVPPTHECEGYFPCYLAVLSSMEGQYLQHYPRGAHVDEALNKVVELLDRSEESLAELDAESKEQAREQVKTLRELVDKTKSGKKSGALAKLDKFKKALK